MRIFVLNKKQILFFGLVIAAALTLIFTSGRAVMTFLVGSQLRLHQALLNAQEPHKYQEPAPQKMGGDVTQKALKNFNPL